MTLSRSKSPPLISSLKVWISRDRTRLVKDGDTSAAILFSVPGQRVQMSLLEPFPNASEFFPDAPQPPLEQEESSPDPEPCYEPVRRGPGRPRNKP